LVVVERRRWGLVVVWVIVERRRLGLVVVWVFVGPNTRRYLLIEWY
jgi:hypothetical protein